jgi:hypothetical protein
MPTQCSRDPFGYEAVEERRMIAAFEGRTHDGCGRAASWTKAGELLGVIGPFAGGLAVVVAEMPAAGTISGGSVNPNRPRRELDQA